MASPNPITIPLNQTFKRLGLVGKPAHTQTPTGLAALAGVAAWLCQRSECQIETHTAVSLASLGVSHNTHTITDLCEMPTQVDALIVVGGDGTMLAVARGLAGSNMPLIGINQGQLGFMTDISLQDFSNDLSTVLQGHYTLESRSMIQGELIRNGQTIAHALALNDAVIARGNYASMVDVCVHIDQKLTYHLRADALVLATPTGSTAYALSSNGPIVHPAVTGFVLVPVAPQTLSNRPIVLPDHSIIDVLLEPSSRGMGATASFDMQQWPALQAHDVVRLSQSPLKTLLVHPLSYDYYHTLRHKLHWTYNPIVPHLQATTVI